MALTVARAVTAKLTAALVLFLLVFMCSWLPGKMISLLHRGLDNSLDQHLLQKVLTGMNCFAGGVFVVTCLLDLLLEFRMLTDVNAETSSTDDAIFLVSETDTRLFAYRQQRLLIPKLSPSKDNGIIGQYDESVHDTPLNRLRRHYSSKSNIDNNQNTETKSPIVEQKKQSLNTSVIILLLILSAHCIFDGLAAGFDPHPTPQALEVTVAVAIHKYVLAFSLGVQYSQSSQVTTGLNRSMLCYSAASPIGIFTAFMFDELIAPNLASLQAMLRSVVAAVATGALAFKIFLDISP